jgi:UbiD family decarboxylase
LPYYKDLREYIEELEGRKLLWRIKTPINKETELMPLVRWQFRGLEEEQRRAFLFENVTSLNGRRYEIPVLVGALGSSTEIYTAAMRCNPDQIIERWDQAQKNPIPAKIVASGPVQEEIHTGKDLLAEGLDEFPFTIDVPGFDGLIRTTASHIFTKDPETGIVNIGNYSGHVHARDRMTIAMGPDQHIAMHLDKARKLGKPLEAAIVIGVAPAIALVSVVKVPYGRDELSVAGGLAGEAIEVVKCQTVGLEVPATAEIVIEGLVDTDYREFMTGSFGEYTGYMAETFPCPVFNITAITHRKKPIFSTIISQMPPSESSKIKQIALRSILRRFLRESCNLPNVLDVACYESSGTVAFRVIQLKKNHNSEAWQALYALSSREAGHLKCIVAVDEDIDPHDAESVIWAISYRMQPEHDVKVVPGKIGILDPSTAPLGSSIEEARYPMPNGASVLLINATRKWDYPPVALPKQEYMEKAREIWEAEGLPALKPRKPWYGYSLGYWPEHYQKAAELNLEGKIYELGEGTAKDRKKFT